MKVRKHRKDKFSEDELYNKSEKCSSNVTCKKCINNCGVVKVKNING
jgi:hypothetical protein